MQIESCIHLSGRSWVVAGETVTGNIWSGNLSIVNFNDDAANVTANRVCNEGGITTVTKVSWFGKLLVIAGCTNGETQVYPSESIDSFSVLTNGHYAPVSSVTCSPNTSTLVTAGWDQRINLYKLRDDGTFTWSNTTVGHYKHIHCLSWHKDGIIYASGAQDADLKTWDTRDTTNSKPALTIPTVGPIFALDWSPSSDVIVTGQEHGLSLYDIRAPQKPIWIDTSFGTEVKAVSYSTQFPHYLAVGADNGESCVFDLAAHPHKIFSSKQTDFVRCVSWTNENEAVYLSGGGWGRTQQKVEANVLFCKVS